MPERLAGDYPHSQHWTTGGFRITVMHYKSSTGRCASCGAFPARHSAWGDGRGDRAGFGSSPAWFCDPHRPEKGTLPPLDYVRLLSGVPSGVITYERTEPWPDRCCSDCDDPAPFQYLYQCLGCDNPARFYSTTRLRAGQPELTERHHLHHTVLEDYRCAAHAVDIKAVAADA